MWTFIRVAHPVYWTTEGMDQWGFLPVDVQWALDRNNAMLVMALLAGLTGAGLAIGEGLHRRSWIRALLAISVWTSVAALFGGLAGFLGHRMFEFLSHQQEMEELYKAILVCGIMFAIAGAGVGMGAGVFLGWNVQRSVACLVEGLLAGVLAAFIYPILVAAVLPGAMTSVLIPVESADRALWVGLPAAMLGLTIPRVARRSFAKPVTGSPVQS